jgi:hypothetical protein
VDCAGLVVVVVVVAILTVQLESSSIDIGHVGHQNGHHVRLYVFLLVWRGALEHYGWLLTEQNLSHDR